MAAVVIILIFLLILAMIFGGGNRVKNLILPTPSAIPNTTPVAEVTTPSVYATDAEVLDIEAKLREFDQKVGSSDLHEDTLRVPNLDWEANFKQN